MVLQQLESAGLNLKRDKCNFMVTSISYLDHKIDAQTLLDKIQAIVSAPTFKAVIELKAILGIMNY